MMSLTIGDDALEDSTSMPIAFRNLTSRSFFSAVATKVSVCFSRYSIHDTFPSSFASLSYLLL